MKFLQENNKLSIEIQGHTDNVGNFTSNQTLSKERAESVSIYLINKGIEKSRIITKGFGSKKPIADNKTVLGKEKNRRVEFIVY